MKLIKLLCLSMIALLPLQGCSMNEMKEDAKDVKEDVQRPVEEAKDEVEDRIDNLTAYFKEKDVELNELQTIEDIDFAADEGRSFTVDGKTVYIYRVNQDDAQMQKVIKEAKENGKVKVNITGTEMEYGARVNQDYLMLYDTSVNVDPIVSVFDSYTY